MATTTTSRRNPILRPVAAALALIAALAASFAVQAQPQAPEALSRVPETAEIVVIVPDLAQLNQELAALKQTLGLPMPGLENALGMFKRQTGMVQGLDESGALLLVLEGVPAAIQAGSKPTMALLVPVTDYQAFLGNYAGNAEDPVASLVLPSGQAAFAKQLDGYAVLGETREAVDRYQPAAPGNASTLAQSLGALGQRYLGEADVAVYVDLERLAPALLPGIDQGLDQMQAQFDQMAQAGMMDPAAMENVKAMYQLYGRAGKAILQSAEGGLVALDLDDAGIALTYGLKYKPGSPVAEALPGGDAQLSDALARLPEQPFIFAVALDTDAIALADLVEAALAALPEAENDSWLGIYRQSLPMLHQTRSVATAYYAPTEATLMSGGLLNAITVYQVDEPEQYTAQFKQSLTDLNGVSIPVPGAAPGTAPGTAPAPGGGGPDTAPADALTFTTSYTDNALQIDGVEVDQYQLQMNFPPQVQQQMMPMMMMLGGASGYNGYIATTDGHVIVTTSTDPQMLRAALQTTREPAGIGTAGPIATLRAEAVTPDPAFVGYLSLQGLAQTANLYLPMFTGGEPIVVPADLPPIAASAAIEDNSAAFRLYLPTEAMRFVQEAVAPYFHRQAVPQGGPGGPHDGAPPAPF